MIKRFQKWYRNWFGSSNAFAGATNTPSRSVVPSFMLDGERMINQEARWQILLKSNWLYNSLGLIRGLVNKPVRYAVGRGITASAVTKDEQWNIKADAWFDNIAKSRTLDAAGTRNFYEMQKAVARHVIRDGEGFVLLVNGEGRKQIQLIEAAKCGFSMNAGLVSDPQTLDGVIYDDYGKPVTYFFKDATFIAQQVDAQDVLHVFDPERFGQGRGLPWCYHGVNQGIDILDLAALEKRAAKVHAAFAAVVKKKTGSFTDSNTADLDSGGVRTNPNLDKLMGGNIAYLGLDEEVDLVASDRPKQSWIEFVDWLVRDIAVGFGVSPEFIWNVDKLGGANTRYLLADAGVLISDIQDLVIEQFSAPIRKWLLADAIMRGELPEPNDPEFDAAHWQGPPSVTVDRGKEGKLWCDLVAAGLMTLDQYWSMQGYDARKMRRQRINEIAEDMAQCETLGVPYELYMPPQVRLSDVMAQDEVDATSGAKDSAGSNTDD